MKITKLIVRGSLMFTLALPVCANAQGQAAAYLNLGVDARILGMGGAGTAVSSDANAAYWNPAGLSRIQQKEFAAMHTSLSLDRNYNFFSLALPGKKEGLVYGFSVHRFSVSGIPETKVYELDDVDRNGRFDDPVLVGDNQLVGGRYDDANPNPNRATAPVRIFSYFEDSESRYSLSAAKKLSNKLRAGLSVNFLEQKLFTEKADGMGMDFGLQYDYTDRVRFGFALKDAFESLSWSTGHRDEIPLTAVLGGSVRLKSDILLAADVQKKERENFAVRFGAEKWFMKNYGLRLGMNDGEFTVGASAKMNEWSFDYAYNDNDLGSVQRISAIRKF
jgi:hypothetical protein